MKFLSPLVAWLVCGVLSAAFADLPKKEVRVFEGYTLEAQSPCNDFNQYKKCFPATLTGTVLDPNKSVIATLESVYYRHYHPFEIHGSEVFWITRIGDYHTNPNWEDQLLVKKLNSNRPEMLFHYQGLDFRASPDGNFVIFPKEREVLLLDRSKNAFITIISSGPIDGYTPLKWSKDSAMFWFGEGVVDHWRKLGVYKGGKVTWFPYPGGSVDEALQPDLGWLVTSDAPYNYDSESEAEYQKSDALIRLTLVDLFTGKKLVIAEESTNYFLPTWISGGALEYTVKGKKHQVSVDEIKEKLSRAKP